MLTQVARKNFGQDFDLIEIIPREDQILMIEKVKRFARPHVGFAVRTTIRTRTNDIINVKEPIGLVLRKFGVAFHKFNQLAQQPRSSAKSAGSSQAILAFEQVYIDRARQTEMKPYVSELVGVHRNSITAVSVPVFKYASALAIFAGSLIELSDATVFYVKEKPKAIIAQLDEETKLRVLSEIAARAQRRSPTPDDLTYTLRLP